MAELLGVNKDKIKTIMKRKNTQLDSAVFADLVTAPTHEIIFNYPFTFIVGNLNKEVITVELRSQQAPSKDSKDTKKEKKETSLGFYNFRVSELSKAEGKKTVKLDGTDIVLNVKFLCRPIAQPSQQIP